MYIFIILFCLCFYMFSIFSFLLSCIFCYQFLFFVVVSLCIFCSISKDNLRSYRGVRRFKVGSDNVFCLYYDFCACFVYSVLFVVAFMCFLFSALVFLLLFLCVVFCLISFRNSRSYCGVRRIKVGSENVFSFYCHCCFFDVYFFGYSFVVLLFCLMSPGNMRSYRGITCGQKICFFYVYMLLMFVLVFSCFICLVFCILFVSRCFFVMFVV